MLHGDLSRASLPDVLLRLAAGAATGRLDVAGPGGPVSLHLAAGAVYATTGLRPAQPSAHGRSRLASRLLSAGSLTPTDLADAPVAPDDDRGLAAHLLVRGLVAPGLVDAFLHEQLLGAVEELAALPAGAWSFVPHARTRDDVASPLPVATLLAAVQHRRELWGRLDAAGLTPDAVLVLATGGSAPGEGARLDPDAWALLHRVDGVRTLGTLADACGLTGFEVGRAALELVDVGLVEVALDDVDAGLDEVDAAGAGTVPGLLPAGLAARLGAALRSSRAPAGPAAGTGGGADGGAATGAGPDGGAQIVDLAQVRAATALAAEREREAAAAAAAAAAERVSAEQSAAEARVAQEQAAQEQAAAEEQARAQAQQAADRVAAELAAGRLAEEQAREAAAVAAAHRQAEEQQRAGRARAEQAAERAHAERAEAERQAAERAEAERQAAERQAAERAQAERQAAERAEAERQAAERAQAERARAERAERARAERQAAEEKAAERARQVSAELAALHAPPLARAPVDPDGAAAAFAALRETAADSPGDPGHAGRRAVSPDPVPTVEDGSRLGSATDRPQVWPVPPPAVDTDTASLLRELASLGRDDADGGPTPAPAPRPPAPHSGAPQTGAPHTVPGPGTAGRRRKGLFAR